MLLPIYLFSRKKDNNKKKQELLFRLAHSFMNNIKRILLLLGLFVIFALVYHIGPSAVFSKAKTANGGYLIIGGCLFLASMIVRAVKWYLGLKELGADCSFSEVFWVYLFSGMVCYFTPWKTGDIVAPFVFKKHFNHSVGGGLSVILIDRIVEFIILTFFILVSAIALSLRLQDVFPVVSGIIKTVIALLAGVLVLMIIIISSQAKTKKALNYCYGFFRFLKIKEMIDKANRGLDNFYMSINQLKNKSFLMKIFFFSCLAITFDSFFFYFVINSTISISLAESLMVQFITIGFSLASFMPTGMGALELSGVYLFSLLYYPRLPTTTGILFMRVISMGLSVLGGVVAIGVMRVWSGKLEENSG